MHITLYKSTLCPRCYYAHKYLQQAINQYSDVTLEAVDILSAPKKAWQDGIRMIPAVKIGDDILTSLYLSRQDIVNFINEKSQR